MEGGDEKDEKGRIIIRVLAKVFRHLANQSSNPCSKL